MTYFLFPSNLKSVIYSYFGAEIVLSTVFFFENNFLKSLFYKDESKIFVIRQKGIGKYILKSILFIPTTYNYSRKESY